MTETVCITCGNTHTHWLYSELCIFTIVQRACWEYDVLSDTSELIATKVLQTLIEEE